MLLKLAFSEPPWNFGPTHEVSSKSVMSTWGSNISILEIRYFRHFFNFWDFPSEKIFPSEKCDLDEKKVHYFHHRKSENDGNRRNHIGFSKWFPGVGFSIFVGFSILRKIPTSVHSRDSVGVVTNFGIRMVDDSRKSGHRKSDGFRETRYKIPISIV